MRRRVAAPGLLFLVVFLALLAIPPSGHAHGIGGSAADDSILEFIPLGIEHMLLGWDHLLFIAGVVLLSGGLRRAAKLISLFVAGHSLTLLIATLAGWKLNATFVDVVIALSVLYVGILGLRPDFRNWRIIGASIFGFGLVHGLGLSTRLQDLGLPDNGLVWRVLAFNLGVEIGQLIALTVIVAVGTLIARQLREPNAVRRAAFGLVAVAGAVAAAVLSFPSGDDGGSKVVGTSCRESAATPPPFVGGGHPPKRFYSPGEEVPGTDLVHVIGDGFVVVRYRPSLPAQHRERLEQWVMADDRAVVAAPDGDQSPLVRVATARRALACSEFDIAGLTDFRDRWLDSVEG